MTFIRISQDVLPGPFGVWTIMTPAAGLCNLMRSERQEPVAQAPHPSA